MNALVSVAGRLGVLYVCAMLQGLTVVSFPASSATLKALHQFSDAQYGAVFLPQVAATIAGSIAGGALAQRLGLGSLLLGSVASSLLAEACLACTACAGSGLAFGLVLVGSALMGLGFGLAAAPLNGFPRLIARSRTDAALMGVHTAIGTGFCLGPLLASWFIANGIWSYFPVALAGFGLCCVALVLSVSLPRTRPDSAPAVASERARPSRSRKLWAFLVVAVLYAFAEGTLSNWVVIYLHDERGLSESSATLALSAFWAALVAGRLLAAVLVAWVAPERLWFCLLVLLVLAFLLVPQASTAPRAMLVFSFAGLACSAFFPLSVTLLARQFPNHAASTASMMVAALMVGVGIASFSIGPLRAGVSLTTIYLGLAVYPALALGVALALLRPRRALSHRATVIQTDSR